MPDYTWLESHCTDNQSEIKLRAACKIKELREALRQHFTKPPSNNVAGAADSPNRYVRIATWNIREFDSSSYGYRMQEAKAYIAEILSHFHLIALQEIRRDLRALEEVRQLLGSDWEYIASDVTEGTSGNYERMAFLFNTTKVRFRGIVGELTLPKGEKITDPFGDRFCIKNGPKIVLPDDKTIHSDIDLKREEVKSSDEIRLTEDVEIELPIESKLYLPPGSFVRFRKNARVKFNSDGGIDIANSSTVTLPEPAEIVLPPNSLVGGPLQFARTPFIASFEVDDLTINLVTVHIIYGDSSAGLERRKEEIESLTKLLSKRAKSEYDSDADACFMLLGDFNIVGRKHNTMVALESNGFQIPNDLKELPGSNVKQDKFYDQIAIWKGKSRRNTTNKIVPLRAGIFDFFDVVYRIKDENTYHSFMCKPDGSKYKYYSTWRTYQMSDHLPMWIELQTDFSDDYL